MVTHLFHDLLTMSLSWHVIRHQGHHHATQRLGYDRGVMPGFQPNMPCTHRQQRSRHKRLG